MTEVGLIFRRCSTSDMLSDGLEDCNVHSTSFYTNRGLDLPRRSDLRHASDVDAHDENERRFQIWTPPHHGEDCIIGYTIHRWKSK
jgi:hypothetical protein